MEKPGFTEAEQQWLRTTRNVDSHELFRKRVRNIEFLDEAVQAELFDAIHDGLAHAPTPQEESEETKAACGLIAESYAPLAVSCAFQVWRDTDGRDVLDELMEESFVLLLVIIRRFCRSEERGSFGSYFLSSALPALTARGSDIRLGRRLYNASDIEPLRAYWNAQTQLAQELERPPTIFEIAQKLDRPIAAALELAAHSRAPIPFSALSDELNKRAIFTEAEFEEIPMNRLEQILHSVIEKMPPPPRMTPAAKMALVERGIDMMPPGYARCLILAYGLFDEPMHDSYDLMHAMGLSSLQSANAYMRNGLIKLSGIVRGLADGSLDLVQWQNNSREQRTVLGLLALMNQPIPSEAPLAWLRIAALRHMQLRGIAGRDMAIMAALYGLHDGQKKTNVVTAQEFGVHKSTVYRTEQDVVKKIAAKT